MTSLGLQSMPVTVQPVETADLWELLEAGLGELPPGSVLTALEYAQRAENAANRIDLGALDAAVEQTAADAEATASDRVQVGIAISAALVKAEEWAENPEDVAVEAGQFSSTTVRGTREMSCKLGRNRSPPLVLKQRS